MGQRCRCGGRMVTEDRQHASIVDVAARAGVSPATVSRALRGLPHVSSGTRRRVEAAARELSYVASPAGVGLASGRTLTVGVVVPLVARWFFAQAVAGAAEVLRQGGYDLVLYNLADAEGRTRFFERMPLRRRVDAVLVVCLPLGPDEVALLQALGVPVVTIGSREAAFPSVRIDDLEAAAHAVRHLVNLGHESIAMISALEDDDLGFSSAPERRLGFRRTLERRSRAESVIAGTWGFEGGERAMEVLLSGEELPSAVFAEYDEMAFGALRTLRRAGLEVPRDISVVGFDDHEMAQVVDLTTVAQPVLDQGRVAAQLLLEATHHPAAQPADVVLPTRLVVRGSTAPARSDGEQLRTSRRRSSSGRRDR